MARCEHNAYTARVYNPDGSQSCKNCGKQLKGPWPALAVPDPSHAERPSLPDYRAQYAALAAIGARHPRSRKIITIFSALATGWLPWGVKWDTYLSRVDRNSWVLSCGYVLNFAEAQRLVTAGLLAPATGLGNWPQSLILTPAGLVWLQENWEAPGRKPAQDQVPV